jgi:hypothetical protein
VIGSSGLNNPSEPLIIPYPAHLLMAPAAQWPDRSVKAAVLELAVFTASAPNENENEPKINVIATITAKTFLTYIPLPPYNS